MTKYHEKHKPAKFDKKQQLEKIRTEYLKKKQEQTDK
ncbi:alcohol dehydrogenase [Lysinibacillus sp. FJAT-14222]|nr:alcohol dehydrogenase [Lysinibacillus sp. FJAT-14222]